MLLEVSSKREDFAAFIKAAGSVIWVGKAENCENTNVLKSQISARSIASFGATLLVTRTHVLGVRGRALKGACGETLPVF